MTANSHDLMIVLTRDITANSRGLIYDLNVTEIISTVLVSGHVMCVSTIIKPRELAVMSCVLVLSILSLLH
jgi:hypothetical protein